MNLLVAIAQHRQVCATHALHEPRQVTIVMTILDRTATLDKV
jgi:hypothetical protein